MNTNLHIQSTLASWVWPTQNTSTTTAIHNYMQPSISSCDVPIEPTTEKIMYTLLMMVLLLLSVFGNCVVVLAVLLSNKLADRVTFRFVASLACSDIVMAVFHIPFHISVTLHGFTFCLGLSACYLRIIMDAFGNVASIINLFLVSMDRFIAVQLPYKYVTLLSKRRTKTIIIAAWLLAACWGTLMIFRWGHTSPNKNILTVRIEKNMCENDNPNGNVISFCGIYVPTLLSMTGIYIRILQVTIRQIREIERNTPKPRRRSTAKLTKKKRWSNNGLRKEIKASKTIGIVYIAFCLCWLPSAIFTIITFVRPNFFNNVNVLTRRALWFTFVDIFPMINTMVNPIIYSFSNTQFRSGVQDVWRKLMGKASRQDSLIRTSLPS